MNKIFNEITIITVLYNSSKIVENFFDSLKNFKIIVVDNGKNEKILDKIQNFKNIQVISKNKNLGYGRAINFAFENVSTNFFLVLNPDLTIDVNSIENMLNIFNQYSDCGIVAPVTVPDKDFYGAFPERNLKNVDSSSAIKSRELLLNSKIEGELCVDVAKGCALLISAKHFKNIGKFDEKYFLFWEEIDLCRKSRSKKNSVIVTPKSKAQHNQGKSSKSNIQNFLIKTFHNEYSPLIYFNVQKFTTHHFKKIIKYFIRGLLYLLILNIKKSITNFVKLTANIKYFFDLRSSSKK
ncbi:MAG: glycosyltransferase [Candidatus Pelagibacter sp.]|tara:strand:- start:61 stop:945 length:885 start_codon:yes stop_codon:yes gene_type:complete